MCRLVPGDRLVGPTRIWLRSRSPPRGEQPYDSRYRQIAMDFIASVALRGRGWGGTRGTPKLPRPSAELLQAEWAYRAARLPIGRLPQAGPGETSRLQARLVPLLVYLLSVC